MSQLDPKTARQPLRRGRWWMLGAAGAGAGLLALLHHADPQSPDAPALAPLAPPTPGMASTGTALTFTVHGPAGERPGKSGEALALGTTLQISYDAGPYAYLAVLGIDDAGHVTVYFPTSGERMAFAPSGSHGPLPFHLTLTPPRGRERFVAVFARGPARLAELVSAAQDTPPDQAVPIPLDMVQSAFAVHKT